MQDDPHSVDEQYKWVLDLDLNKAEDEEPEPSPVRVTKAAASASTRAEADPGLAQILAKVPLFRRLHRPQLKKMLALCAPMSFDKGERVCTFGETADTVLILLTGELSVSLDDGVQLATVRPVTTIGEMGFVTHWKRTVNLDALEPCSMMVIRNSQLQALLQADAELHVRVLQNIVTIMAARIMGLNVRMRQQLRHKPGDSPAPQ